MKYRIEGEPFSVVIVDLEPGEKLISECGAMSWMSPNMKMETVGGGAGKMFGRMLTGEALTQNHYTAEGGPGQIAFAASFPGSIRAVQITPDSPLIVQKKGFLACQTGVELSIHRNNVKSGIAGGEGFFMQKLTGNGLAFIEIDGHAVEYELAAGQQIVVDTGYVAAMSASCTMEIQRVQGFKNMFFGGEGFFNTIVKGPGKVTLQTMPINALAGTLQEYFPNK